MCQIPLDSVHGFCAFSQVFWCQPVYVWKYSWVWRVLDANIHSSKSSDFAMCLPLAILQFLKSSHTINWAKTKPWELGNKFCQLKRYRKNWHLRARPQLAPVYHNWNGEHLPISKTFGEIKITKESHCEQKGKKGGRIVSRQLLCR